MFLTSTTMHYLYISQATLPQTGKIHGRLLKLAGETPLADFISGTPARELYEGQDYQPEEGPGPLSAIPAYSDLNALADRLTTEFGSLPWQYTLAAALPPSCSTIFCAHIKYIELSDAVSIRSGDDFLAEMYPLVSGVQTHDQAIAGAA